MIDDAQAALRRRRGVSHLGPVQPRRDPPRHPVRSNGSRRSPTRATATAPPRTSRSEHGVRARRSSCSSACPAAPTSTRARSSGCPRRRISPRRPCGTRSGSGAATSVAAATGAACPSRGRATRRRSGSGQPGSTPWLPQPASWAALSVAAQSGDPSSMLELYRAALGLRASAPRPGRRRVPLAAVARRRPPVRAGRGPRGRRQPRPGAICAAGRPRQSSSARTPKPRTLGPDARRLARPSLTYRRGIPIIPLGISPRPARRSRRPGSRPTHAAALAAIGAAMTTTRELVSDQRDEFAFHDDIVYLAQTKRGLTRETVEEISADQGRAGLDAPVPPARLRALPQAADARRGAATCSTSTSTRSSTTASRPSAKRSPGTTSRRRSRRRSRSWASPRRSASSWPGVGAQYDSEVVYHSVREELTKIGVVFMGTDQALKEYPEIFRKYFATVVPPEDNKFAALNSAVWSGGSFVYVPKGVEVPAAAAGLLPHQRREHRPVRADPDRRRRGRQGPLHRGLHRPDLRDRLAPRRGRRGRSRCRAPRSATRRSRTGRTTSTTWSRSGPTPTRTRPSSGSTRTPAAG